MRKYLLLAAVAALAFSAVPAVAAAPFPDEVNLPDGLFPEGVAIGRGTTFYVGSLADGSIFKGDLRTGEGEFITDPAGPFATVGIEIDRRERIWVAGGLSGGGRVYDGRTGELLESYTFTGPFESFINDVVVTRDAAYFTDSGTAIDPDPGSFQFAGEPRLFVVPLGPGWSLPGQTAVTELDVDVPDLGFPNLNGIETSRRVGKLIVGHTNSGTLYEVDPDDGDAAAINIGTGLFGIDGLVRSANTLYVVENALGQISAVELASDGVSGSVAGVLPVPGAETPTTAGIFGNALYVVDAKFVSGTGPYTMFRIDLE